MDETNLITWFERDRAHVCLETLQGETIVEWRDEDVQQAVEDGFLIPGKLHQSAYDYAKHLNLV